MDYAFPIAYTLLLFVKSQHYRKEIVDDCGYDYGTLSVIFFSKKHVVIIAVELFSLHRY